jgi:hypothetical protein
MDAARAVKRLSRNIVRSSVAKIMHRGPPSLLTRVNPVFLTKSLVELNPKLTLQA